MIIRDVCKLTLLVLFICGCGSSSISDSSLTSTITTPTYQLAKVPFFEGNLKRLEPHLHFTSSACFKLDVPECDFLKRTEVWVRGKLQNPQWINSWGGGTFGGPGEISLTLKQTSLSSSDEPCYVLTISNEGKRGRSTGTSNIVIPYKQTEEDKKNNHSQSWEEYGQNLQPLKLERNQPVVIWGYRSSLIGKKYRDREGGSHSGEETPEQFAINSEWAILVYVKWTLGSESYGE